MPDVDAHVHWVPPSYYQRLARRDAEPRTTPLEGGAWRYENGIRTIGRLVPEWFDLDAQVATMDATGHADMVMVNSLGVHSDLDGLPAAEARVAAEEMNEELAAVQRAMPGRFFAAAAVPLQDPAAAIEVLEDAVRRLDLRAVSLPGSVAGAPIDGPQMEDFYACVAALGVPAFVHPTDAALADAFAGYEGDVHRTLGRMVDSSVAVLRLILSGVFDRVPDLRILHFHAGGVLPYIAGRLDKNTRSAKLEEPPSAYLRRMYVDTAAPTPQALELAVDFYEDGHVLYGSDNPCWQPQVALEVLSQARLSDEARASVMGDAARAALPLGAPAPATR